MSVALGYAAALAGLPGMSPMRLRHLLAEQPPEAAWEAVGRGDEGDLWRRVANAMDVAEVLVAHQAAGIEVAVLGDARYPKALADHPSAPAVVFASGRLDVVDRPMVAIMGKRPLVAPFARHQRLLR